MAIHSSILAWKIPWTEELGRLDSLDHKELDTTEPLSNVNAYLNKTFEAKLMKK